MENNNDDPSIVLDIPFAQVFRLIKQQRIKKAEGTLRLGQYPNQELFYLRVNDFFLQI
jgi:hypothetical protein